VRYSSTLMEAFVVDDPGPIGFRAVFIDSLVLFALIGIREHEKRRRQRVRISLRLGILEKQRLVEDKIQDVVCYDEIITSVKTIVARQHYALIECLAEAIAKRCLEDSRIYSIVVKVEKIDVYPDCESVGVQIFRFR
jgi:7,8-dihydroneopterin aldolase/epimerase/oxygenase